MKNTMKKTIAVFLFSIIACAGSAFAWPWGNVGLNVDEPEAQLDVGGDVIVRSNLLVRGGGLWIGERGGDYCECLGIRSYNGPEDRYDRYGVVQEDTFCFGPEGGPFFGFGLDGRFGANASPPWYEEGGGPQWGNEVEGTNRASIRVRFNPPGFIFNVNGVIWTNTP